MLMSIEEIRQALTDRKTAAVANATNLHPHTIRAIRSGKKASVSSETLKKLTDYFYRGVRGA